MNTLEYEQQKERIDNFKSIQNRIDEIDRVLENIEKFNLIRFQSKTLTIDKLISVSDAMRDDLIRMLEKRKTHLQEQLEEI